MMQLKAYNTASSSSTSDYNVVPSDPAHLETARIIGRIAAQDYPNEVARRERVYRVAREYGFYAVWVSDEEVARWNKEKKKAAKRRKAEMAKTARDVESGDSVEPSHSSGGKESTSGSAGTSKSARSEGESGEKSETAEAKVNSKVDSKVEDKVQGNVKGKVEEPKAPDNADADEEVRRSCRGDLCYREASEN
jgi:hypothetical protein